MDNVELKDLSSELITKLNESEICTKCTERIAESTHLMEEMANPDGL